MIRNFKAILSISFFLLNTLFWCLILYLLTFLRLLTPFSRGRDFFSKAMAKTAESWVAGNILNMQVSQKINIQIHGLNHLRRDRSYFLISNHQSWVDIVILQFVFNRKIPFLRFFLKKELKYVPLLGLAWKALDFPFMERHSKEYLRKYPAKKGTDLETTRKACEAFKGKNISIINFVEGTRYSMEKAQRTQSEFKRLLPPKAGGFSFVLSAMGDQFESLLDITLYYPEKPVTLWRLFSGHITKVIVDIQAHMISKEFCTGNYLEDRSYRAETQAWITELWKQKDERLLLMEQENKKTLT